MASIPPLIRLLQSLNFNLSHGRDFLYRYSVLVLTFLFYMSYHLSRKPISIVKGELHHNCSKLDPSQNIYYGSFSGSILLEHAPSLQLNATSRSSNNTWCDWKPFDRSDYQSLYGALDYAFLFAYAISMFISGYIGERLPLRYFLGFGMILCGIFTSMFGMGYFWNVHVFWYYVVAQLLNGIVQTTGWPGVVAAVGKWFGKGKRGLIMGIWNSHTSVGNILGSVIASVFVSHAWGWSFVVPGIIIASMGVLCLLALVEQPEDVGCRPPDHQTANSDMQRYMPIPSSEPNISSKDNLQSSSNTGSSESVDFVTSGIDPNLNQPKFSDNEAISLRTAILIPGVIEFSLCLLFAKLVSYTFLFWLPYYIQHSSSLNVADSGLMSTLFDIGGIVGGITAGLVSDVMGGRATTCGGMLIIGAVMMYMYNTFASISQTVNIALLLITGAFVNGPYALITTAVSADLGTHAILEGNSKALATVTAIIDGTGSIGAAIGPLLTGFISQTGWNNVFYMLIASNIAALLFLTRLIRKEILGWIGLSHSGNSYFINEETA